MSESGLVIVVLALVAASSMLGSYVWGILFKPRYWKEKYRRLLLDEVAKRQYNHVNFCKMLKAEFPGKFDGMLARAQEECRAEWTHIREQDSLPKLAGD